MQQGRDRGLAGESFETAWRERFEEFAADRNDDAGIAGWSATGLAARMRRFSSLRRADSAPGLWLDAGCGAGSYSRYLLERGAQVVGIDYSVPSIVKARTRCPPQIHFLACDVRRLPFAPAAFDGVLCFGVMQALGESTTALDALADVVRPGGELWVDALNHGCVVNLATIARRAMLGRRAHLRYEWPGTLCAILRARSFTDVTIHWMPIVPSRWKRLQQWIERPSFQRVLRWVPLIGMLLSHAFIVRGRKLPQR